ncbi:MAG: Flp pilus assembly complex ATPase component TadA [Elusimicrobia bacterium]|nr:Flp pilus assembly complex ATPase component TadA [Elusimicrobiota bacterium]
MAKRLLLQDILLKEKIVDQSTYAGLTEKAKKLGKTIEQLLVENNIIEKAKLLKILSTKWGVKPVDLDAMEIDEDAARLVPELTARRYLVLPFSKADNKLYVAMARPWDLTAIEDLHLRTNYEITPYLALSSDIEKGLNVIFTQNSKITDYISNLAKTAGPGGGELEEGGREEISFGKMGADDEKQARKIANAVILEGLARKASDFHIEPFEKDLYIRYRIDGQLQKSTFDVPKSLLNAIMARIKIMSHTMDITEKRVPQDGRIQVTYQNKPIEFRVNTIPTAYGESCVMRVLDRSSIMVNLEQLGFLPDTFKQLTELLKKPYGIVLVSGPTGSGKSTTLYSALNYLLEDSKKLPDGTKSPVSPKKILTAENPVEYDLAEVVQLPVNPDIDLTFSAAMRAFLRQDPDIIMVGEIRDRDTAQIAMEAALTGHFVLSTIHTNDAPTSVSRLAEMQVPTYLISSALEGVLAQRLIRTICKNCKEEMKEIPKKLMEEFDKLAIPKDKITTFKGKGCKECNNTGYKGRSGIHELLIFTPELRELLMTEISSVPITKLAKKQGMRQLWEDGIMKIAKGVTTYEELLRVCQ